MLGNSKVNKLLLALGLLSGLQLLYPQAIMADECSVIERAEISINSTGAYVCEERDIELKEGDNKIYFEGIHPSKVRFESLSSPNSIIFTERRDVLSDGNETISKEPDRLKELKSLKYEYGRRKNFDTYDKIVLTPLCTTKCADAINKKLSHGMTLFCNVNSKEAGQHPTWICYWNYPVKWKNAYKVTIHNSDKKADVFGQINIENKSNFTYRNADLKLESCTQSPPTYCSFGPLGSFLRKPNDYYEECHQYKVLEKVDLPANTLVQMRTCEASGALFERVFVFEPAKKTGVQVELELDNSKKNNLGIAFPAGNVRIYQKNEKGVVQFLGEDFLEHVPVDQKIRFYLNDATGLTAKRIQSQDKTQSFSDMQPYTCRIDLQNNRNVEATVTCIEHLAPGWRMIESSQPYSQPNSRTFEFTVKIPAHTSKKVTYVTDFNANDVVRDSL